MKIPQSNHYLALSGGVGGAKLVLGLSAVLEPDQLTVVANTGDDFEHLGLNICPDIDTVLYTLADWNNKELGWGQAEESWNFLAALKRLGGEGWFSLGDRDMATHILRTQLLDAGASLSEVIERLSAKMNIAHRIVPMTDEQVRTQVHCRVRRIPSSQPSTQSQMRKLPSCVTLPKPIPTSPQYVCATRLSGSQMYCQVSQPPRLMARQQLC